VIRYAEVITLNVHYVKVEPADDVAPAESSAP